MKKTLLFFFLLLCIGATIAFFYFENPNHYKEELTLYGNVDIRTVDLGFRVSGRIEKLFFEEGDLIQASDLLAQLDPIPYQNEVDKSKAQLQAVKINLENAQSLYERREELVQSQSVSKEDRNNALSTRNQLKANLSQAAAQLAINETALKDTQLLAPSPGIILTRIREPGTIVSAGDPVYSLSLLNPIWIRAYVKESELGKIYPGMEAEITNDSGGHYTGHIGFISPLAEFTPKSVETTDLRTDLVYRLRIIIDNSDFFLRQGMPVTVKIPLKTHE